MALEIVAFSLLCIYHKQVCTLFENLQKCLVFFSNNKIIFDFQIFEFFKRFKTCYIFYDLNTLCSGSSSTGIMRFAFKLVGGTALVFPGFQLWGAKLENPFFFSTALYQSLFHKPFSCPLSFTLDVITVISQGSANKTLYFSVLLSGFFLVLKGKRPFFFFNVNAVVRLRRQGLSWATTIFPACLFFRKPKSMGQQKKLTFFSLLQNVFSHLFPTLIWPIKWMVGVACHDPNWATHHSWLVGWSPLYNHSGLF